MIPVEPTLHHNARLVVFGVGQPEYIPLPASVDTNGLVMTEWEPTAEELHRLFIGGRIRLWLYGALSPVEESQQLSIRTGVAPGRKLTPILVEAIEPECGFEVES